MNELTTPIIEIGQQILEDVASVAATTPMESTLRDPQSAVAAGGRTLFGEADPVRNIAKIHTANTQANEQLRKEPFVVRVLALDEDGQPQVYYFSRATPSTASRTSRGKLASYRSSLGRLAECEPGESVEVVVGGRKCEFEVLENVRIQPQREDEGWDAINARFQLGRDRRTVRSVRKLLDIIPTSDSPADDLFAEIEREQAQVKARLAVQEGFRREARRTLSLRDQPTVDRYQGEVFRLPLNHRILLVGPPGTGKTTTLIKRLAQKLDPSLGEESELHQLDIPLGLARRWVMFSPTDLLKLYLKEAFSREQVPASEEQVKTWTDERHRLARDVLGILKVAKAYKEDKEDKSAQFVLRTESCHLRDESSPAVWALHEAFREFLDNELLSTYERNFATALDNATDPALHKILNELRDATTGSAQQLDRGRLYDLVARQAELAKPAEEMGGRIEKLSKDITSALMKAYPHVLADVAAKIDTLLPKKGPAQAIEEDEEEEGENSAMSIEDTKKRALIALARAFRWLSLAKVQGKAPRASARYAALIRHLGTQLPPEEKLFELGRLQLLRTAVVYLSESHRNLVERLPEAFQRFRREKVNHDLFYLSTSREALVKNEIGGSEVDVLILAMLRNARELMARPSNRRRDGAALAMMRSIEGEYRLQVLVDEATDFSAVQLACMHALSDPRCSSLFASGDLRQRMTPTGIRTLDELRFVVKDIDIRHIHTGYRQSPVLTRFSRAVASLAPGEVVEIAPYYSEQEGDVPPLLCEGMTGAALASWVAARIIDIERSLEMLPSVAIFVGDDEQISPLVKELSSHLTSHNIIVRGCRDGRDVGNDNHVRVFSARYIKGLEFEAVFVVDLDQIAAATPDLAPQILYVAATRAARYLALTCADTLPSQFQPLRSELVPEGWTSQERGGDPLRSCSLLPRLLPRALSRRGGEASRSVQLVVRPRGFPG